MIDEKSKSILKIADTHVKNLQSTLDDMTVNYPFSVTFIVNMNKDELRTLETIVDPIIETVV